MLWTRKDAQLRAHHVRFWLRDRTVNTATVRLNRDEALGLVAEITKAFGIDSVPSTASYDEIELVIENPDGFYPKDAD